MKTAIMTDSNSGITPEEARSLGIFLMPMPIIVDGTIRFEGEDLTQEEFYESLSGGMDISTSQPSPGDLMDMWDHILDSGYDELVYIPMSSGLSNSCSTAIALSDDYDGKVQIADNHRISVTQRGSVLDACKLADSGASAKEIRTYLEETAYEASIFITVDSLTYLKKGGRITPAVAALGSVLNIKPILSIQGERLDAHAKVRGLKKGKQKMIEALREELDTRFHDFDRSRIQLATAGSGLSPEQAEEWRQTVEDAFQADVIYYPLSLSVGTHTGPGSYGIGLYVKK
jgi:DegV family protein with EDD domain